MEINCNLIEIDEIKKFVQLANKCKDKITVKSNGYIVDGKSILGIFSLDLSKPVIVEVKNHEDALLISSYCHK